jgi:hypothetical protein
MDHPKTIYANSERIQMFWFEHEIASREGRISHQQMTNHPQCEGSHYVSRQWYELDCKNWIICTAPLLVSELRRIEPSSEIIHKHEGSLELASWWYCCVRINSIEPGAKFGMTNEICYKFILFYLFIFLKRKILRPNCFFGTLSRSKDFSSQ